MPRDLNPSEMVRCPYCRMHTAQVQAKERGRRICTACGKSFTLKESKESEAWVENNRNFLRTVLDQYAKNEDNSLPDRVRARTLFHKLRESEESGT